MVGSDKPSTVHSSYLTSDMIVLPDFMAEYGRCSGRSTVIVAQNRTIEKVVNWRISDG